MTDPEDRTGRHGGWANKISVTTLIVIVFALGGAFVEAKLTRKAVDELAQSMKENTAAASARLQAIENWRIQHEAISAPLMADYMEERKARIERGKRR